MSEEQQPPSLTDVTGLVLDYRRNESIPMDERYDGIEEIERMCEEMLKKMPKPKPE